MWRCRYCCRRSLLHQQMPFTSRSLVRSASCFFSLSFFHIFLVLSCIRLRLVFVFYLSFPLHKMTFNIKWPKTVLLLSCDNNLMCQEIRSGYNFDFNCLKFSVLIFMRLCSCRSSQIRLRRNYYCLIVYCSSPSKCVLSTWKQNQKKKKQSNRSKRDKQKQKCCQWKSFCDSSSSRTIA